MATTDGTADPDFTIVMRGYERHEVDAYLRDLVAETSRLGDRVAQLESELSRARASDAPAPRPEDGFKALGEETTRILVAAETAAREMREKAERQADAELAAAEKAARDRVETASAHADRIVEEAEARQRDVEAEIARLEDVRASMVDSLRAVIGTTTRAIEDSAPVPATSGTPAPEPGRATPATPSPFEHVDDDDDLEVDPAPGDGPVGSVTVVDEPAPAPEPEPAPAPEPAPEPEPEPEPAPEPEPEPEPEPTPEPAATAPATEEPHGGADRGALEAALAEADEAAGRAPTEAPAAGEPGVLRDRSLAGIRPGMLRRLRRALQELQNGVLESVRTRDEDTQVDDLLPSSAEAGGVADVARMFLDAGYRAGRVDAPVLTGGEPLQDPPTDADRVSATAARLADELLAELRTTLTPSLRAGIVAAEADASLSERVGEVFRDLKGPIVETVVDRHLTATYGEATLDAWTDDGVTDVVWVLGEETRCPEGMCRANEAEGAVGIGSDFPSGHAVPLAHEGCTCALTPV